MSAITLRPYQARGLDLARAQFRAGNRRVLLVGPTGMGKTVVFAEVARGHLARGGRVLVLVHRRELISQTVRKLHASGVDRVGTVAAGAACDPDALIQVASVQTLLAREALPPASLLVLDEAHHYVAEQWGAVAASYQGARMLGVTATPERSDGTPLGDLFDSMVIVATVPELIAGGYLAPIDVVAPPRRTRTLAWDPVAAWHQHSPGRKAVLFASNVAEAKRIAAEFASSGVAASSVDGTTPESERDARLEAFDRGDLQVLTNCQILTEGWDCPSAEICMLARGCESTANFLQMVGRVLRLHPAKARALLIDLRGVVHDHGLPDEERTFSLFGRAISSGGGGTPIKTCPACAHVVPLNTRLCPFCAFSFSPEEIEPDHCQLVKVTKADLERTKWEEMVRVADVRGYKLEWVGHRFREEFGRWPRKFMADARRQSETSRLAA